MVELFERLHAHSSVKRLGYLLSSRRPVYCEAKWQYMKALARLTRKELQKRGLPVIVFDLRDMVHPLSEFFGVDRVHLNTIGHHKKAQRLLQMFAAAWPDEDASLHDLVAEPASMAQSGATPSIQAKDSADSRHRSPSADSNYTDSSIGETVVEDL